VSRYNEAGEALQAAWERASMSIDEDVRFTLIMEDIFAGFEEMRQFGYVIRDPRAGQRAPWPTTVLLVVGILIGTSVALAVLGTRHALSNRKSKQWASLDLLSSRKN